MKACRVAFVLPQGSAASFGPGLQVVISLAAVAGFRFVVGSSVPAGRSRLGVAVAAVPAPEQAMGRVFQKRLRAGEVAIAGFAILSSERVDGGR